MRSAVLFLVFNRPDTTRKVFEAIRAAKPQRLYVAADGPRMGSACEAGCCAEVRRIVTDVDWLCDVKFLFREQNLGCKMGPYSGISWFFEHEEEGIIIEDDILPLPSFFPYCDELLERYRDDERVGLISGSNIIYKHYRIQDSYFFSQYSLIWGWASWRRAWQTYDIHMHQWPSLKAGSWLKKVAHGRPFFECYWRDVFDKTYQREINTWDYQWTFSNMVNERLCVIPKYNQTENLGFGPGATHTTADAPASIRNAPPMPLSFPLKHPKEQRPTLKAEMLLDKHLFGFDWVWVAKQKIKSLPYVNTLVNLYNEAKN